MIFCAPYFTRLVYDSRAPLDRRPPSFLAPSAPAAIRSAIDRGLARLPTGLRSASAVLRTKRGRLAELAREISDMIGRNPASNQSGYDRKRRLAIPRSVVGWIAAGTGRKSTRQHH